LEGIAERRSGREKFLSESEGNYEGQKGKSLREKPKQSLQLLYQIVNSLSWELSWGRARGTPAEKSRTEREIEQGH